MRSISGDRFWRRSLSAAHEEEIRAVKEELGEDERPFYGWALEALDSGKVPSTTVGLSGTNPAEPDAARRGGQAHPLAPVDRRHVEEGLAQIFDFLKSHRVKRWTG